MTVRRALAYVLLSLVLACVVGSGSIACGGDETAPSPPGPGTGATAGTAGTGVGGSGATGGLGGSGGTGQAGGGGVPLVCDWYFSDDAGGNLAQGDDSDDCSLEHPCRSLSKAQDQLDALEANDEAVLCFDRGDVWDASAPNSNLVDGRITSWTSRRDTVLRIHHGTVTIGAYGSGDDPVFDGGITNWETNPLGNGKGGTDSVIMVQADYCTIQDIDIRNHFGHGIDFFKPVGDGVNIHDGTITNCHLSEIGFTPISGTANILLYNMTFSHNTITYAQRLEQYGHVVHVWGGAISFQGGTESGGVGGTYGNQVHDNFVYRIWGEGIVVGSHYEDSWTGSTVRNNIIGDTWRPSIHTPCSSGDAGVIHVRDNIVFETAEGRDLGYTGHSGISIMDEVAGGDNSTARLYIYGNLVVGKQQGLYVGPSGSDWGHIWIHDNTFVDNRYSIAVSNNNVTRLDLANNAFIQYELDVGFVYNGDNHDVGGWHVDTNLFYGGVLPTTAPWNTNMVTGDPRLSKTSGWRSLAAAPSEADATPQAGSALIDAGLWWTTIASATSQGQSSFAVGNAGLLQVGASLMTEGGEHTTVTDLAYGSNVVGVSPAIDIVSGEGVVSSYGGARPDVGAYEVP